MKQFIDKNRRYINNLFYCVDEFGKGFCFDTSILSLYKVNGENENSVINAALSKRILSKKAPIKAFEHNPNMCDTLTFVLTHNCNMRCSYCYYGNQFDNDYKELSSDEVFHYYKLFDNYFTGGIESIHFFGGEPLIAFPKIQKSVELIENYCIKNRRRMPSFGLNTNALLFDKEIIDYFYAHKVGITISLDGKKENNICRIRRDGTETFDSVITNIEMIKELHPDYIINVESTYTARNVIDFQNTGKHDIEIFKNIGFSSVHLVPAILEENNPLNPLGNNCDESWTFNYIKYAYDFMFKSFDMNHPIVVDDYTALVLSLKGKKIRNVDCHAGIKKFTIDTTGDCYPCHIFISNHNYRISSEILSDKNNFFDYINKCISKYDRNNMHGCADCWCKNICVDCRFIKHTKRFCNYKKYINEYLLNYIANGR